MGVNFSKLDKALAKMGAKLDDRPIEETGEKTRDIIQAELSEGVEVLAADFEDLQTVVGMLSYKGENAFLYIKEPNKSAATLKEIPSVNGPRFHIIKECQTLQRMHKIGKFKRYHLIQKLDGTFPTIPYTTQKTSLFEQEIQAKLLPCRNCLNRIKYNRFRENKKNDWPFENTTDNEQNWHNFNVNDFFNHYEPFFFDRRNYSKITKIVNENDKMENVIIRDKLLNIVDFTCEEPSCKARLQDRTDLLHLHHVNGQVGDNSPDNLKIYCFTCHRQKPLYQDVVVPTKSDDSILIAHRRKEAENK